MGPGISGPLGSCLPPPQLVHVLRSTHSVHPWPSACTAAGRILLHCMETPTSGMKLMSRPCCHAKNIMSLPPGRPWRAGMFGEGSGVGGTGGYQVRGCGCHAQLPWQLQGLPARAQARSLFIFYTRSVPAVICYSALLQECLDYFLFCWGRTIFCSFSAHCHLAPAGAPGPHPLLEPRRLGGQPRGAPGHGAGGSGHAVRRAVVERPAVGVRGI